MAAMGDTEAIKPLVTSKSVTVSAAETEELLDY